MKIAIIGAGAIGTLFAGLLARSENDISILVKTRKTENIISSNGIKITGLSKFYVPPSKLQITTNPKFIINPDLIIILVKSYNTLSVLPSLKNMIGENTYVLTLQNGIGNYQNIIKSINKKKVLVGVTSESAIFKKYGEVEHTGKGETIIGNRNNVTGKEIARVFSICGIRASLNEKIDSVMWSKLVLNCAINPVAALSEVKNGDIINYQNLKEISIGAGKEVMAVAGKLGIKLLFKDVTVKITEVCKSTSKNINSMLVDVKKARETEIEYMNGAVVKIAERNKIPVFVNNSLYQMVKNIGG